MFRKRKHKDTDRITNQGLYLILLEYYIHDHNNDDKMRTIHILELMDKAEEYLKPLESVYREEVKLNQMNHDLISPRQSACMTNLIESLCRKMYSDMIKEFIDMIKNINPDGMEEGVELNQFVIYNIVINVIRRKLIYEW